MIAILIIHAVLVVIGFLVAGVLWRQRRRLTAVLAMLIIPALMWIWYQMTSLDSVASWLYSSDTEYAKGFSRDSFLAISIGSESQSLTKIIGAPLDRRVISDDLEYWHYSRAGKSSDNYWNYVVVVDRKSGRIVELFSEFYVD